LLVLCCRRQRKLYRCVSSSAECIPAVTKGKWRG
jgi:hypothetical protein